MDENQVFDIKKAAFQPLEVADKDSIVILIERSRLTALWTGIPCLKRFTMGGFTSLTFRTA